MSCSNDLFPGVSPTQWRDWRWQQRHALRDAISLARIVDLTEDERRGLAETANLFRVGVTPYYASLMDRRHPFCPVRMQAIPSAAEARRVPSDLRDPLGEDPHRPVRAIVHKYPDRVLFLAVDHCAVYCRHCTRRRITSGEEGGFDRAVAEEGIAYVRAHPEVRDVLISGGDPLSLSDEKLGWLLREIRAVRHVEIVRVGTRAPVTCPMRVDEALAGLLRRHAPLFVVTHFNHPKECTQEARRACELLVDHGVPVENQTVLLRRVNSSARTITDLNQRLLTWRVRPYYLHQGDVAEGTAHLRTPLAAGLEIIEQLRGHTSGLAVPHLAIDLPGGGGKVTVQPDYFLRAGESDLPPDSSARPESMARTSGLHLAAQGYARGERAPESRAGAGTPGYWFRNYRGERYFYPEPLDADCSCPYDEVFYRDSGSGNGRERSGT